MKRIGMGLVGPGFIAAHHIDAVRRLGDIDIIAIAGSTQESANRKAKLFGAGRAYDDYRKLIADPDVHVIHNTTPNYLHFPVAMTALNAKKHIVSDKPLAITAEEGRQLRDAAFDANVAHVVTFNYRGNPMVQQARGMVADGEVGELRFVYGYYLQDWMADINVYSWRSDQSKAGQSSALSDIGSHWCDLAEHVAGKRITAVLADLATTMPMRYRTSNSTGALSRQNDGSGTPVEVRSEDLGSILIRFEGGGRGCFSVGQALPGHKNDLQLEINGSTLSLGWRQEQQNELWIGHYNHPNRVLVKDPALVKESVRHFVHLPGGHHESWGDAFYNVVREAYAWIREGGAAEAKPDILPDFSDGYRSACIVEAMLQSNAAGNVWKSVQHVNARR